MLHRTMTQTMALVGLVLAAGCASTTSDEIGNELFLAQTAITTAEETGADEASPAELAEARDKLTAANRLAEEGEHERAEWLAAEAIVDAELAAAKAQREQTDRAVQEIEQDLEALRREALDRE